MKSEEEEVKAIDSEWDYNAPRPPTFASEKGKSTSTTSPGREARPLTGDLHDPGYSPTELVDRAATFQPKVYFWTQILLCHHTHHTFFKFQFELQDMTRPYKSKATEPMFAKSEANMSPISMAAPAPWHGTRPMSHCSVFTEICFPYNCLSTIMLLS